MERGINLPDTRVCITLVKSVYLMGAYFPTIQDVHLQKGLIRELVKYRRRSQRVFATDKLGPSRDKGNSFVLESRGEEKGGKLRFALVPLFLMIVDRGGIESQNYIFFRM